MGEDRQNSKENRPTAQGAAVKGTDGGERNERRRPERLYIVEERLVGTAEYHVMARNKREAMEKVRHGDGGYMLESVIDHMGRGHVRRATEDEL